MRGMRLFSFIFSQNKYLTLTEQLVKNKDHKITYWIVRKRAYGSHHIL